MRLPRERDRATGQNGRRTLGSNGEAHAAAWLEARGWRVLARNVRAGGVELAAQPLGRQPMGWRISLSRKFPATG